MADKVYFEPEQPERVALRFAKGKPVDSQHGPSQVFYSLTDGRCMYADQALADQIDALGVRANEEIEILKTRIKNGRFSKGTAWVVSRVAGAVHASHSVATAPLGERSQPEQLPDVTPLEQQLQQSIAIIQKAKAANELARPFTPGNGHAVNGMDRAIKGAEFFAACGFAAVDAALQVEQHATKRGLKIAFETEDVRCLWNSLYIQAVRA